jgi:hypothetical protein
MPKHDRRSLVMRDHWLYINTEVWIVRTYGPKFPIDFFLFLPPSSRSSVAYFTAYLINKSCPATRHEVAWGERGYSSYSFSTSALDGGEWSESRPGRALPPGKGPPVSIVQEAGWAPEPVWTQRLEEKSFRLCRGSNPDSPVVQPVARHYTYWASRLTFN